MDAMQPSVRVRARKDNPTETSSLATSPTGDSTNTKSAVKSENTTVRLIDDLNEELANLLVLYKKAGGSIATMTLPAGKEICGSQNVIVLPASVQKGVFSLMPIKNG